MTQMTHWASNPIFLILSSNSCKNPKRIPTDRNNAISDKSSIFCPFHTPGSYLLLAVFAPRRAPIPAFTSPMLGASGVRGTPSRGVATRRGNSRSALGNGSWLASQARPNHTSLPPTVWRAARSRHASCPATLLQLATLPSRRIHDGAQKPLWSRRVAKRLDRNRSFFIFWGVHCPR